MSGYCKVSELSNPYFLVLRKLCAERLVRLLWIFHVQGFAGVEFRVTEQHGLILAFQISAVTLYIVNGRVYKCYHTISGSLQVINLRPRLYVSRQV